MTYIIFDCQSEDINSYFTDLKDAQDSAKWLATTHKNKRYVIFQSIETFEEVED